METLSKYVEGEQLMKNLSKNIDDKKSKYSKNKSYESINAYIRWIISNVDMFGKDYIFGKNIVTNQDINFVKELENKEIVKANKGKNIVKQLKSLDGKEKVVMALSKNGWIIEDIPMKTDDKDLAIRYYSIGAGNSQHWSVLPEDYEKLVKGGPKDILEGFASPFNHYFEKYCTIFPEDKGSQGNFFDQNLEGKTVVINPPFIIDILDRAAEKCRQTFLDINKDTKIIFIAPTWIDSNFFILLKRSEFLQNIDSGYHNYIDKLTNNVIHANFSTTWFILQNYL